MVRCTGTADGRQDLPKASHSGSPATQNRFLLRDDDGNLTEQGWKILDHTPVGRFGEPEDLLSTVEWLLSPRSSFVTGAVIPIAGRFAACSGV